MPNPEGSGSAARCGLTFDPGTGDLERERYAPAEVSFVDLPTLPTDLTSSCGLIEPRDVVPYSRAGQGSSFVIGDLLAQADASPELRSALIRVPSLTFLIWLDTFLCREDDGGLLGHGDFHPEVHLESSPLPWTLAAVPEPDLHQSCWSASNARTARCSSPCLAAFSARVSSMPGGVGAVRPLRSSRSSRCEGSVLAGRWSRKHEGSVAWSRILFG